MILYYFIKICHKDLLTILKHDIYSIYGVNDNKTILNAIKSNKEFKIIFYFRVAVYFSKKNIIMASVLKKYYIKLSSSYCITIPLTTVIGRGFRIGHIGNITIHYKTIIGDNVTISQGVTLGKIHTGKKTGAPVLGKNIYIGPNAVIVGNIKIGNDVIISGNAFVNSDVPDNSIVIGNPGVVHYGKNPTANILNCLKEN
jgi:serine O-acetyltransferase